MNNPEDVNVDVAEMREWLMVRKRDTGMSWSALARESGVKSGTLSAWGGGSYPGREDLIAQNVFKYRQMLETQAEQRLSMPIAPGFIEMPTAMKLRSLMVLAQTGKITLGATAPGIGKTFTMQEYQASVSNVWCATMRPTTGGLTGMVREVLKAVGGGGKGGWARTNSAEVINAVRGRQGLLMIDEAGHLDTESIEEIRAWHDETGVGICLLGNHELYQRVRGGARHDAFGRLNSRIFASHIRRLPEAGDVELFLDSWNITDTAMRDKLTRIAMQPSAGALREIAQIIELASILADQDGVALGLSQLRDAIGTRASGDVA